MFWFLDTLVDFPVAHDDGEDGMSVMVSTARRGDSPPYHVHHTEDEAFHLLEGELVLLVDGRTLRARAGETLLLVRGVPHTFRVVSERARWLVTTTRGDFERFVREVARPALVEELPAPSGPPSAADAAALGEIAARHGIELLGGPLTAEVAEAA